MTTTNDAPAPAPSGSGVRDRMARKLYETYLHATNRGSGRLDLSGIDINEWFDTNASMPLSGPPFVQLWHAMADASLASDASLRGEADDVIACLLAEKPFWFDPATNFVHADDGGGRGIRWAPAEAEAHPAPATVVMRGVGRQWRHTSPWPPFNDIWREEQFYNGSRSTESRVIYAVLAPATEGTKG